MTVWVFIEKDRVSQEIIDMGCYGSLRKLVESKEIYIKGFKLPETSFRKMLKSNNDDFENDVYKITKMKLETKTHN